MGTYNYGRKLRLPAYARRLKRPVVRCFVTTEWTIGRRILKLRGPVIVVRGDPSQYDLSVLSGADCWLMYLNDKPAALRLKPFVESLASRGEFAHAGALFDGL